MQQEEQQPVSQDDAYDEYVYYPYYPQSVPGGYEYVPEPRSSKRGERPNVQYYDERVPNNPAPIQRT